MSALVSCFSLSYAMQYILPQLVYCIPLFVSSTFELVHISSKESQKGC